MKRSEYHITLDIHSVRSQVSVPVPQNDTARSICVHLSDGGNLFLIPDGCRAVFAATKADGKRIFNDCIIERNTLIRYDFTAQTTNAVGKADAQIILYGDDGGVITSPKLSVVVYESVLPDDELDSSDEMRALDALVSDATALIADVETKLANGEFDGKNGVYVGSGEMPEDCNVQVEPLGDLCFETGKPMILYIDENGDFSLLVAGEGFDIENGEIHARLDNAAFVRIENVKKELLKAIDEKSISTDETLTASGAAADSKVTGDRFKAIDKKIEDILYTPIAIKTFVNDVGTKEIGSYVRSVTLSWSCNKTPTVVTIDNESYLAAVPNVSLTGLNIREDKTFTLTVMDERGESATKTTSITFLNGVYYGVAHTPETLDSTFILGLTRNLRTNKLPSFTVTAGSGEYIWYCVPKRFGECIFSVGGFTGGFLFADTVSFTNASGYTEDYYVYRSDTQGLGKTTVAVT